MADVRDEARQIIAEALMQAVHDSGAGSYWAYAERALTALERAHLAVVAAAELTEMSDGRERAEALLRELANLEILTEGCAFVVHCRRCDNRAREWGDSTATIADILQDTQTHACEPT